MGKALLKNSGLSLKTVKSLHGILLRALSWAVKLGHLRYNPSDVCALLKVQRKEFIPLDSAVRMERFFKSVSAD